MKSSLQWFVRFPEVYFILVVLLAGYSPVHEFNMFSWVMASALILQLIFEIKLTGIFFSIVFSLITLYFTAATSSELTEFSSLTSSAYQLALGGFLLSLIQVVFCVLMWKKYLANSLDRVVD